MTDLGGESGRHTVCTLVVFTGYSRCDVISHRLPLVAFFHLETGITLSTVTV